MESPQNKIKLSSFLSPHIVDSYGIFHGNQISSVGCVLEKNQGEGGGGGVVTREREGGRGGKSVQLSLRSSFRVHR